MNRDPILRPDGTALIPLTLGLYAIIDQSDLDLVAPRLWQAHARADGNGYYARSNGKRMHRIILGCGPTELGDHRDGDGLNNRRYNLRLATRLQNSQNRIVRKEGLPVGVREIKGRFYARIREGDRQVALGGFGTADEAHLAYVREASARYGEWLHPSLANAPAALPS
jgi:hypothetical protein